MLSLLKQKRRYRLETHRDSTLETNLSVMEGGNLSLQSLVIV